jgi:hypothetical protein
MKIFDDIGIQIPQIYLPKPGTDLAKWAVIACDQFTSQPEYWQKVEQLVGDSPSTLNLTRRSILKNPARLNASRISSPACVMYSITAFWSRAMG